MRGYRGPCSAGPSDDRIPRLVEALVRAPFARRWRLDAEVRESAAHLAIAEALATGAALDDAALRAFVERRFASELRGEARRRRRRGERETPLLESENAGPGYADAGATPEALVSAAEVAALVERRARAMTGRRRAGRRAGAAEGRRRCGAGATGAGGARHRPPSAATRRRWRAEERDAIRRAAREVLGR